MSKLAVAGLQLELSSQNNLHQVAGHIESTIGRFPWLNMIVVGELATYGPSALTAQPRGGEAESLYCELALKHGIWLIPGSLFEQDGDQVFNTSPVINPAGEVVARYRKIFPFSPYENDTTPGEEFVVFDVPGVGRLGLCICYDAWFPEVSRTLAWMGAEAIICPTMTNTIDRDIELCLARTNAASNQCYFFNLNVAGKMGMGQSISVGPEGNVLYQAGSGHEIITVEMDFDLVRHTRERGVLGLCQTLKSFRDCQVSFAPYDAGRPPSETLANLGPLTMPERLTG